MKHLVEFPLAEGGSIVVEVDEPESAGTIRAARGETITKVLVPAARRQNPSSKLFQYPRPPSTTFRRAAPLT